MPSLIPTLGAIYGLLIAKYTYQLVRNYIYAKRTGLPIIIVPWDPNSIFWIATSVPLRPYIRRFLPTWVANRLTLTIYGWESWDGERAFQEHARPQGDSKSFFLVTTGKPEFSSCDPEVLDEVFRRPKDFLVPDINKVILGKFGPNVVTSNGEHWSRQRRLVASVINERISKAVFEETIGQTTDLLGEVYDRSESSTVAETNQLLPMMRKIAINVLSGAGMGEHVPWQDNRDERPAPGYKMTYIQSCKAIIHAVQGPIILPQWFLHSYPKTFPGHKMLHDLGTAIDEFPLHTKKLCDRERERAAAEGGQEAKSNIMSQLLKAVSSEAKGGHKFTDSELTGNLFVFTIAGFDAMANTLSYALLLLCCYPAWQDWMFTEIDTILHGQPDSSDLDYNTTFPQVVRILAIMFETLRLFTPLIRITRETDSPQTLTTSKRSFFLPAKCTVYLNSVSLHLDPTVWRDLNNNTSSTSPAIPTGRPLDRGGVTDEATFRPTRWVSPPGAVRPLFQPPKGAFTPWSAGPRVCPGQKMAQVEFAAVFLTLFRGHRIEAVKKKKKGGREGEDETDEALVERLRGRLADSTSVLTLQMNGVFDAREGTDEGVAVRFVRRPVGGREGST